MGKTQSDKRMQMIEYFKACLGLRFDTRGVTALEYALIGGFVAVVIVAAVSRLGTNLNDVFIRVGSDVAS